MMLMAGQALVKQLVAFFGLKWQSLTAVPKTPRKKCRCPRQRKLIAPVMVWGDHFFLRRIFMFFTVERGAIAVLAAAALVLSAEHAQAQAQGRSGQPQQVVRPGGQQGQQVMPQGQQQGQQTGQGTQAMKRLEKELQRM